MLQAVFMEYFRGTTTYSSATESFFSHEQSLVAHQFYFVFSKERANVALINCYINTIDHQYLQHYLHITNWSNVHQEINLLDHPSHHCWLGLTDDFGICVPTTQRLN